MESYITITLLILLLIAAWQDIRCYRIPNALVFSGATIGILLHTLLPHDLGGLGILHALTGLGVGFIVLLPLYVVRAMGAGDIKLMAMIGAFAGPGSMLEITLYILLAGGVLAIGFILLKGKLSKLIDNFKTVVSIPFSGSSTGELQTNEILRQSAGKLPYGVAIAGGTLVYFMMNH